jgi:type IV secretory pathway VirB10-like protein
MAVITVGCLAIGGFAAALVSHAADDVTVKKKEDSAMVPDDQAAAAMLRLAKSERPSEGTKRSPDAALAGANAPLDLSAALGTAEVAPLSTGGAGATPVPPQALIKAQRDAFNAAYADAYKMLLASRLKARMSPMRVESFDVRRHEEQAEAAALVKGMGASEDEDSEDMGLRSLGKLGDLAALGASPALAALSGRGMGGDDSLGSSGGAQQDPNFLAEKRAFFQRGGSQLVPGRLGSEVQAPYSRYELQMGAVIPGVLISGISSEAPGQIIGQVSENVYDSATGSHLLIPQGSRLVGTYSATVANGQARVQVAWVRLNFPNGHKLDLGGMSGSDQAGVSGFRDRVNRHFAQRLASALMTSALTIAYEMAAPRNGGFYENAIHRGAGESIVRMGIEGAQQSAQIPPTLEIRPGYRFNIAVNKDIVFPAAYADGIERRRRR